MGKSDAWENKTTIFFGWPILVVSSVCVCVCVHTISRLFVTCWASEIIQSFWTVVVDQEAKRKRERGNSK